MSHMEKPPAVATLTAKDNVGSGKNDNIHNSETDPSSQAGIGRSAAVAAALERNHKRLIAIKRRSIASLGNMAAASLDGTMEAIENVDDEAMLERAAQFFENVRGFARLLGDFRDTKGADQ
jgi:hypothetical protein